MATTSTPDPAVVLMRRSPSALQPLLYTYGGICIASTVKPRWRWRKYPGGYRAQEVATFEMTRGKHHRPFWIGMILTAVAVAAPWMARTRSALRLL